MLSRSIYKSSVGKNKTKQNFKLRPPRVPTDKALRNINSKLEITEHERQAISRISRNKKEKKLHILE